jgi:hypothetical protein
MPGSWICCAILAAMVAYFATGHRGLHPSTSFGRIALALVTAAGAFAAMFIVVVLVVIVIGSL